MEGNLSLKAALIPLTTLNFTGLSLDEIRAELRRKQSEAPALFRNLPCVLDLTGLAPETTPLGELHAACVESGLQPIAVRNAGEAWTSQLENLQLADLGTRNPRRVESPAPASTTPESAGESGQASPDLPEGSLPEGTGATPPEPALPPRAIRVHKGNIRSGQQFHFDGDLVIQGTVNPGAEVLATGDIHVYGALRGKVLAGIKGDESAVIGCQQFDPELVAIAGHYRLFEEEHPEHNQSVVIRLEGDALNITSN